MKKQIKLWSMMMLMMMALPLMTACGSDDKDNGGSTGNDLLNKAIGTWMCTESTDISQGRTMEGLMVGKEVTIRNDGTYTSTASTFGYTGTYTINGNQITAKSSSGTFVVTVTINNKGTIYLLTPNINSV